MHDCILHLNLPAFSNIASTESTVPHYSSGNFFDVRFDRDLFLQCVTESSFPSTRWSNNIDCFIVERHAGLTRRAVRSGRVMQGLSKILYSSQYSGPSLHFGKMVGVVLQSPLNPTDDVSWSYTYAHGQFKPHKTRKGTFMGIQLSVSPQSIELKLAPFPSNRILHNDDPSEFVLVTLEKIFRFEGHPGHVGTDYLKRFFASGVTLNGKRYRFYGHSNSQLRGRSCFFRRGNTDKELDERIYKLGSFEKIMNVAKRAKRIGLLFSGAEIDYDLDPRYVKDIPDIISNGEMFSDGCGLIAKRLAAQLSRKKGIIIRGKNYVPTVYQIRYRSYKGVLMVHPDLDKTKDQFVHFRDSMKKFTTTIDKTLSVVAYSEPYSFGRLNSDIVVLLSALGVSTEQLVERQAEYFKWISDASEDVTSAANLLSAMGKHELVERLYLDGIEDREVRKGIAASQNKEIKDFKKEETGKDRVRMLIPQSRLLFGVCDPYKVLRPGEVHVRITTRTGATTLKAVDVMVIRNPCLHPGDLLKLRATDHPQLSHLVDCVVFSSVGKRPAPSMSSGGDLDGDKFMVCWDEKIVPKKIAESYDYPAPKERISGKITRTDLANHFASYNAISLGRISTLHRKWAIAKGAMSPECQELNALHSQCVDGAGIKIPDRLQTPPEGTEPFVLDVLAEKAKEFAAQFTAIQEAQGDSDIYSQDAEDVHDRLIRLLKSDDPSMAMSEFELVQLVLRKCRQSGLDVHRYLPYINWNALSAQEKYMLGSYFVLNPEIHSQMWNSLLQSNIVRPQDLTARGLNRPLRLQRLYSSEMQGRANFFEYFKYATQDFVRKVVLVRMDNRFSIGIFIRGKYEWDADPLVGGQVAVCSFQPTASQVLATYRTATVDYRLHASDNRFQLYNKNLANTFIFINRPPPRSDADLTISIALQQINANVQRQIGRINREHVTAVEIHVVSPRDREAHQLFDLRFSHVPTEELMRRFAYEKVPWLQNSLRTIDWEAQEPHVREIMRFTTLEQFKAGLHDLTLEAIGDVLNVAITYHSNDHASIAFEHVLQLADPPMADIAAWLDQLPALAHLILKNRLEPGSQLLPPPFSRILMTILQCIIRSANEFGIMALVALEKLKDSICLLDFAHYAELLWLAVHSVRYFHLCQEILMVLSDCREEVSSRSPSATYAHHHALAVVSNRAQEANAECRCDPNGRPAKQKQAPLHVKIFPVDGESRAVKVHVRVDSPSPVRLGSHVRLRAEMVAQNDTQSVRQFTMDGIVNQSSKGELRVDLLHTPPPELTQMQWLMYHAGITTTSRAMLDAIIKLDRERRDVCRLFGIITGEDRLTTQYEERILANVVDIDLSRFNDSQQAAILSASNPLSLIWGPPGTGKTTVVVALLSLLVKNLADEEKILMTASTHNAVDNVLERFIELGILDDSEILRVATDVSKVNKKLQKYTIDAQIGGSTLDNPRLIKQAEKRAKDAVIVFTTCTGAGLGVLRKIDFGLVIIDEASQVTEPDSLIPLVKGCKQAVLVGDHVQLRPTVQPFGKALQFDVSLMERLYTSDTAQTSGISRIMLNVQYRFPLALARFPSTEFYNGELQTGTVWTPAHDERMRSQFPWPVDANRHLRTNVFVPCAAEEDMCRSSKSNQGQVSLVAHIVKLLQESTFPSENIELQPPSIAVITPYTRQLKELKQKLPPSVTISTIDGFQGRESDIIVYTTVRCNEMRDIGFLDDARRLNVAWTRARLGRIIVGHRSTLTENSPLWGRALDDCEEVIIDLPAEEHGH